MALDKAVREKISSFRLQRKFVLSLIEFAERFNANTAPLLNGLKEIDQEESKAERYYIDMDLSRASSAMDKAIRSIKEMHDRAVKVKDRALMWIYVVEWCAVTGTMTIIGFVLYTVMVRRRLYREVEVTRFGQ